jgi:cytochrome c-type biogenesis protein CcmF
VRLDRLDDDQPGPNYTADRGNFTITQAGGGTRTTTAERRIYAASGTPTTEASIQTYGFSQLYIQLGEDQAGGAHVLRLWYKPFVTFIWLGAILMAFAGFISLSDRRLRVGAPRRATARVAAAEAAE